MDTDQLLPNPQDSIAKFVVCRCNVCHKLTAMHVYETMAEQVSAAKEIKAWIKEGRGPHEELFDRTKPAPEWCKGWDKVKGKFVHREPS